MYKGNVCDYKVRFVITRDHTRFVIPTESFWLQQEVCDYKGRVVVTREDL